MKKRFKYILVIIFILLSFYFIQYFSSININIGSTDWWTRHHHYVNSKNDSKNVYVIVKNKWFIKYQKYNVKKKGSVDINIPKNSEFILSLHANATIAYKWTLLNLPKLKGLEYLGDKYIAPAEYKFQFELKDGESSKRQNLYFKSLNSGNTPLKLRYRHREEPQPEYNYDILVNLSIDGTKSTTSTSIVNSNTIDNNVAIPEYFKRTLSLGTYNENISLDGSHRDPRLVSFKNNLMIFPKSNLISITAKTSGTLNNFLRLSSDKAKSFLSLLETSKVIDETSINKNIKKTLGAEVRLILLNPSNEYIMVSLKAMNDNNHWISIYYSNDDIKKVDNFCIQSKKLTEKIKQLSNWRKVSNKALLESTKITGTDLYNNLNKKFELTPDEIKILTTAISKSQPSVLESGCPFDLTFEATLDNGEMVHMIWADDSCGYIGIEGSTYRIPENYRQQINDILTKKSPTPR